MLIREFKKQDADIVLQNADKFTVAFELELALDAREMNAVRMGYGEEFFKKFEYDTWSIFEPTKELFVKFFPSLVQYIPHLTFKGDGSIKGRSPKSWEVSGFGIEIAPKLYFKLLNNGGLSSLDFLEKFYNDYPKQKVFVLNKSCGFHVNVGFEGRKGNEFNSALAFLSVNHKFSNILAPDRENNNYASDIRTNPINTDTNYPARGRVLDKSVRDFARKESRLSTEEKLIGIFDIIERYLEASESHYNGFSIEKLQEDNYIEFRFPGGDFVTNNSLEKIKNTILYYCYIIYKGFFGKPDASTIKKAFAFYEKLKYQFIGAPDTGKIEKLVNKLSDGSTTILYVKDHKGHRRNGPAETIIGPDGKVRREIYMIDGVRHREDGPAVIEYDDNNTPSRTVYYWHGDIGRREDEPSQYFYGPSGELQGVKYFKNGAVHRDVGPAIVKLRNGKPVSELYYINDREVTKEEQEKWASLRGLMENKITIPTDRTLLTESFLTMWGHGIRKALEKMFDIPVYENVTFQGRRTDVEALYRTLAAEKRYIDAFIGNGLSDPRVTSSKYELEKAIYTFESQTGIKWPII